MAGAVDPLLIKLAPAVTAAYANATRPWFQSANGTCQIYRSVIDGINVFTFGPTETFWEWLVDFNAFQVPVHNHPDFGPVHKGFWDDIQTSLPVIRQAMADLGWPPWYGAWHSKGNEGILAAAQFISEGHPPLGLGCYEPPCVGGPDLTALFAAHGVPISWSKTMNRTGADIVTQVPEGPSWEHQGIETILTVPDGDGIAQKHEWPAVLAAVQAPN